MAWNPESVPGSHLYQKNASQSLLLSQGERRTTKQKNQKLRNKNTQILELQRLVFHLLPPHQAGPVMS